MDAVAGGQCHSEVQNTNAAREPLVACYLDRKKADHWMHAFAAGCDGRIVLDGERDPEASDHCVMGNWPVASELIADFKRDGTSFWYMDSAYLQNARQRYLRVERNKFWPTLKAGEHTPERARNMGIRLERWQRGGRHVLICLHGFKFGRPWGIDIAGWHASIVKRIRAATDREIIVRPKLIKMPIPLEKHLKNAWCVVTHSSTAAVTAALAGVPVFCEPTCAAAPVGCTDFSQIENPVRPDREPWLAELAWRQFSIVEMRSGKAWDYLKGER